MIEDNKVKKKKQSNGSRFHIDIKKIKKKSIYITGEDNVQNKNCKQEYTTYL